MLNIIGDNMHDILVAAFVSVVLVIFAVVFTGYDIDNGEDNENNRQI